MNSRIMDPGNTSGGNTNLQDTVSGHGCINMMSVENVVIHSKYYGMSQPNLGKEPAPPENPFHIEKNSDNP